MLPVSTETVPSVAEATQDPVRQRALDGDLKSAGSTDLVSPQTEFDADTGASVVKNAGLNTENGASDAQGYKPAQSPSFADTVRKFQPAEMFLLLAVALSIMAFLAAIVGGIAAKRREPIISDYSDCAWSSDQWQQAGMHEQEWIEQRSRAQPESGASLQNRMAVSLRPAGVLRCLSWAIVDVCGGSRAVRWLQGRRHASLRH
jgi:hypothetical protein